MRRRRTTQREPPPRRARPAQRFVRQTVRFVVRRYRRSPIIPVRHPGGHRRSSPLPASFANRGPPPAISHHRGRRPVPAHARSVFLVLLRFFLHLLTRLFDIPARSLHRIACGERRRSESKRSQQQHELLDHGVSSSGRWTRQRSTTTFAPDRIRRGASVRFVISLFKTTVASVHQLGRSHSIFSNRRAMTANRALPHAN